MSCTKEQKMAPSSGKTKKDVYVISSDDEQVITPQKDRKLRTRLRALQDDSVPSSHLPKQADIERGASARKQLSISKANVITIMDSGSSSPDSYTLRNTRDASARKQLSIPKANVITIMDSESSSPDSDEAGCTIAKTPDSYTLRNTRGTRSVSLRKGSSAPGEIAWRNPSSSGVPIKGLPSHASPSNPKSPSLDLIERLGKHNKVAKKKLDEQAKVSAAQEKNAEAKARSKRVSAREAIDQVKKMTNRKTEPKSPMEEIPDSFFEDTDLSEDHLGDDIIHGPLQSQSQSQSTNTTTTPKDQTPRLKGTRRRPRPSTSFTPINTLYPEYEAQPQVQPSHTASNPFGLHYPKHFRDRFSDAEQSDEDDIRSVGSEGEKFWRGEVLDEGGRLPKAFNEYSWKYITQFVSLGHRGYTHVGDGPWEGLIISGRHRGKYIYGCEPPSSRQIAEEEETAQLRLQTQDWEESESEDDGDDAQQVELPPCSLKLYHAAPDDTTPTPQEPSGHEAAKISDESDLRSTNSGASSVLIRKQLEAECPPSNQQLGILMSSSPSRTPTSRSKVNGGNSDESLLPPKRLAHITASAASDNGEDGKGGSQDSSVLALQYVLQESPRWLDSLTTTKSSGEKHRKSLEHQETPTPKKRKHSHDGNHASAAPVATAATSFPSALPSTTCTPCPSCTEAEAVRQRREQASLKNNTERVRRRRERKRQRKAKRRGQNNRL